MPRFFVRKNQIEDGLITIIGDDAHHISRSLRMAKGDKIVVCDMQKTEYDCELCEFLPDEVLAKITEQRQTDTEPPFSVTLYQALPKGEKLDSIIQKSVECGVSAIVTFNSERCIAKEKGNEENKLKRRQRIAEEAAKQSGRGIIPEILPTIGFGDMLNDAARADIALFCYEGDGTESLRSVMQQKRELIDSIRAERDLSLSIVIGSEGGFSLAEVKKAIDAGMIPVGLGKRILRTETASSFVLGCLVYELEM